MGKAVKQSKLRGIPAVEKLLQALGDVGLPRPVVVGVVRREVAALREAKAIPGFDDVLARLRASLDTLRLSRIQPVVNGTGILIHTNLGRSPLSPAVVETLSSIAANYNNLEYDLVTGERGGRSAYLEHALALLCEAEAATVANNCAAALVLILRHFTSGERREVIISRGELVQIGGGFRIPEILEASGAKLREVGTTNKTTLRDYERAIGKETALILKVHRSNFFMGGFVESPSTEEIAALARKKRVPFVEDLGSGAVIETEKELGLAHHEPTPAEVLRRGVDLVCFSGDKLLGGPQAGIIVGKAKLVAACKKEPFFRALRCDKLILSALQTVVDAYLGAPASGPARGASGAKHAGSETGTPIHAMLRAAPDELRTRAERICAALSSQPLKASVGTGKAQVGGGTLPQAVIESVTVDILPHGLALTDFAARLRAATPPVIGYVGGNKFKLDLRTVFPRQDEELIRAIRQITKPPTP
jgi:L-seryl-tRNA(Ser) seleniumtransferase